MAPQTPAQKRANQKFHRTQENRMGTYRPPKVDKETRRKMEISEQFKKRSGSGPTISKWWVVVILFALVGGGIFEFGGVIWDYGVWALGRGS